MAADIDPNLYIQAGAAFKTWHPSRKDATQVSPCRRCGEAPHCGSHQRVLFSV